MLGINCLGLTSLITFTMDLGEVNYYFVDVHLSKLSKGIMSKEAARAMEIELHIQGCIKCFTAFE